jgi:hypothetical protein
VDAPATLNGRRQDASTLQVLKSLAANRNPFPERTETTIAVIHSRLQEAQVCADFCQPLRAFDSTLSFQPIPANMPVVTGTHERQLDGECRHHCASFAAAEVTSSLGCSRIRHAARVVRDALRTRPDSQQHVAELQAQNDQLRMGLRQVQMHHAAQPLTPPPAPPQKDVPSQARQNAPTLLS